MLSFKARTLGDANSPNAAALAAAKEALAWLKSKKLTPGFDYRDVWKQEHSIGFTVAKMTQLDLLSDVKALVEDAMASGQSFAEFREVLKPCW
jgi:uncharacterized protein with gpF-like domain